MTPPGHARAIRFRHSSVRPRIKSIIDDIVVLDGDDKPVGLIDTQDLARLRIV